MADLKFKFDLKKTAIFQAVKWADWSGIKHSAFCKKFFSFLFGFVFLLFLFGFFGQFFSEDSLSRILGLALLSLVLGLGCWIQESFFELKLKKPRLQTNLIEEAIISPEQYNLAELLSFEVARSCWKSIQFAQSKKISEISSSILFYFLLKENLKLNFIFFRANLSPSLIKGELKNHLKSLKGERFEEKYSNEFQNAIFDALKIAQKKGHQRVEAGDLLTALAQHNSIFKKILVDAGLRVQDIENLVWWQESLEEKIERSKKFWSYENLIKKGSLAKDWAAGYTITLDQYSIDWTEIIKKRGFEEIIGHKNALAAIERILSRSEINNALVVGEPGTGRKSIIHALALKALYGQSLPDLNYKRVVELDLVSLLSQITSLEEVEVALDTIFREVVRAGNIILVIDEFHNYVGQVTRPGIIDISGALSPYLHIPAFQIVAITSYAGLHKYIEQNPSLLSLFEKVEVSGLSPEETILILESLVPGFEQKYKKFITYPALQDIVAFADRYIQDVPFPKKAVDLLDEVMVYASRYAKTDLVLPKHIAKIISEKTQIPVGEVESREREILLNLENLIHQRIINQDEAVEEVSSALRRARADITVRKGPMGTFLFLGPTGVGKTETSKALAEIYFGSEEKMIRLDMSEFQAVEDIPRLIGSAGEEGLLTTPVRENPFSLILLDEIEKAHPNILNLFLQVLDEGHITDGLGRKVSFLNSIIIATSNAGYKVILEALREKAVWSGVKEKLLDFLFAQGIFRPEFINRFDTVVVFSPLTRENLLDIAQLLLSKLKKNLVQKNIEFIITEPLKEKIVELSYNPVFGAREMRRVIQDKVEDPLATAFLEGKLKRGDKVEVDPEEFRLIIKP